MIWFRFVENFKRQKLLNILNKVIFLKIYSLKTTGYTELSEYLTLQFRNWLELLNSIMKMKNLFTATVRCSQLCTVNWNSEQCTAKKYRQRESDHCQKKNPHILVVNTLFAFRSCSRNSK